MKRKLVIYHANCNDGFCAAWVAWRKYPDAEFYGANYNQPPPDVAGRKVLIVDFSYPRKTIYDIYYQAATLVVLDHHKTAEADLKDLHLDGSTPAEIQFDMERSGAGMTWDWCFTGEPRPWIVDAVEDRDLWRFKLPDSREMNASITTWPRDFKYWNDQYGEGRGHEQRAVQEGRAILRYLDQYTDEMCERARWVNFEGHTVPCVNVPYKGISEVCGKLAEQAVFSIGWAQEKTGKFVYSLRSRGDYDVSAIAKKYGGGGHKNAAGFNSDKLLF